MNDIWSVIFGLATVILGIMSYSLNKEKSENDKRLGKLREYGENTKVINYQYVNVIMFGPRNAGKTSLAQLWTSPWTVISELQSSQTWRKYETDIYEFAQETFHDAIFDVDRTRIPTIRLRIHDYPGEPSYRLQALKDIKDLGEKVVAVFMFNLDYQNDTILCTNENASYYSRMFVEEVNQTLKSLPSTVEKAIIVFNKIDCSPQDWSKEVIEKKLMDANQDARYNLERLFSPLEYHFTSAWTNQGLIKLLGSIGLTAIESQEEQEKYLQIFQATARIQELKGA